MAGPLTTEKGYAVQDQLFWAAEDGEDTPELRWPLNIPIYDRMRRQDAQVISVIRAVTLPIRRTEWRIDPNGAPPEVAEFVAKNLNLPLVGSDMPDPVRLRGRFSWQEHLRHALLMLTFGHSFFEQVYQYDGDRLQLRKLAYRPPLTISQIDVASDGGLVAIEQHGTAGKPNPRITVDRLVAYVNDREGGNWLGASLLRPAYKYWVLKDRGLRVESQTIVRNGLGVPVYTGSEVPSTLPADDIKKRIDEEMEAGRKLAQAYRSGASAGASIPHGAGLDLKGVTGHLPDARKPIQYYDEQIARAVLAHFLNLGGDDSTGSYALGDTFADFFTLSLQTVANQIADVANQHVIEDLVDVNFGEDVPAPKLMFDEIGSRHPATAEGIRALVDCGALTADEPLETFIRTTHGLPAYDPATARQRPSSPPATPPEDPPDDDPVPPDTEEQT